VRSWTSDRAVLASASNDFPRLLAALRLYTGTNLRTVLDAGANAGFASSIFAHTLPGSLVVAVEPDPQNYASLRLNTHRFGASVIALRAALWGQTRETLSLGSSNSPIRRGLDSYMVRERPSNERAGAKQPVYVAGFSVPALLHRLCLRSFDFVKMDIEGGERSVFDDGAPLEWLDSVSYLYMETHEDMRKGSRRVALAALRRRKFTVFSVQPNRYEHVYLACNSERVPAQNCMRACVAWQCGRQEALEGGACARSRRGAACQPAVYNHT